MEPRFTKNSLSRWPQCQSRTGRAFDNKSGRKNEFFVYFCSILIGITSKHQVPYSWAVSLQLVTININFLEKCKIRLSISPENKANKLKWQNAVQARLVFKITQHIFFCLINSSSICVHCAIYVLLSKQMISLFGIWFVVLFNNFYLFSVQ